MFGGPEVWGWVAWATVLDGGWWMVDGGWQPGTPGSSTYRGGQLCVLHCSTDASGRLVRLQSVSSTSALVRRFLHIGRDIL